ncbi:thioesterase family protein [Tabrizicola sp.]|uniref:acyl-CoA thioesterase n=1 Tax=Tabrizicola sp. TaxID=2005166 RepID=UPI00286D2840|nr:thioesterase family protein [Tabrizicola sp.]
MIYRRTIPVEFNHCDPAGIVFYPRYFEMTNSVVENFFCEVAGRSFAMMMQAGEGVPTARLETEFHAPSRLGEGLEWRLAVTRLGGSSVSITLEAWSNASHRVTAKLVLVWVEAGGRPKPWPAAMRERIAAFTEAEDA